MYFRIESRCPPQRGGTLALSPLDWNTIGVELASDAGYQLWSLPYAFELNQFLMVNKQYDAIMWAMGMEGHYRLGMSEWGEFPLQNTLGWLGDRDHVLNGAEPDWRLNLLGDGPYNPGDRVNIYPGSGGNNTRWDFVLIDGTVPTNWYQQLVPGCLTAHGRQLALSLHPTDHSRVVVDARDQTLTNVFQLWAPLYYFGMFNGQTVSGILLVNKHERYVLRATADRSEVATVAWADFPQYLDHTLWTSKGGPFALRPLYNSDQNLNVLGSGPTYVPGNPVGIWNWGGGAPNETWTIIRATPYQTPIQLQPGGG